MAGRAWLAVDGHLRRFPVVAAEVASVVAAVVARPEAAERRARGRPNAAPCVVRRG